MEKISLKSTSKEIIYRNDGPGLYFDAFSYQGSSFQEKNLGSLFVIGSVKYGREDLSYLISLAASLAKREYYASVATRDQNPKASFENALKKLNEVLEDFFKNREFELSMGLAAVAGENIYLSKMGKIKAILARENECIDILNNIALFNKEVTEEKEFSNIVSGKLKADDKLLMFIPVRHISSREKSILDSFRKNSQPDFRDKIADLAGKTDGFTCCAVHAEIKKIKEIPVTSRPNYQTFAVAAQNGNRPKKESQKTESASAPGAPETAQSPVAITADAPEPQETPQIIPADVSIVRRKNIFTALTGFFTNLNLKPRIGKRANFNNRLIGIIAAFAILVAVIVGYLFVFGTQSSATRSAIKQAKDNIQSAQTQIAKNDLRSARAALRESLDKISALSAKDSKDIKSQILKILDSIDKTSPKLPSMLWDLASKNTKGNFLRISALGGDIHLLNNNGELAVGAGAGDLTILGNFKMSGRQTLLETENGVFAVDPATGAINRIDKKSKKLTTDKLKDFIDVKDFAYYEANVYDLSGDMIYKYTDGLAGGAKRQIWAKQVGQDIQSIAVDGNVFLLSSGGKLSQYFKGDKKSEFDLAVNPSPDARIFTAKDLPFVYLASKTEKRIMVFDKTNGALAVTYDLSNVESVNDVAITKDQTIFILGGDNKVWQVK